MTEEADFIRKEISVNEDSVIEMIFDADIVGENFNFNTSVNHQNNIGCQTFGRFSERSHISQLSRSTLGNSATLRVGGRRRVKEMSART